MYKSKVLVDWLKTVILGLITKSTRLQYCYSSTVWLVSPVVQWDFRIQWLGIYIRRSRHSPCTGYQENLRWPRWTVSGSRENIQEIPGPKSCRSSSVVSRVWCTLKISQCLAPGVEHFCGHIHVMYENQKNLAFVAHLINSLKEKMQHCVFTHSDVTIIP